MNKRLKNTLFSALVVGMGFILLQLILSIDFSPWLFPDSLFSSLFLLLVGALIIGSVVGKTFEIILYGQFQFLSLGIWSFVLIVGILLPATGVLATILFFIVNYGVEYKDPVQYEPYIWFFLTTPYQVYGALFGVLTGSVFGIVFGKGTGKLLKITLWAAFGFGLGGYLMGWIAPIDTYLGPFNPNGPVMHLGSLSRESVSIFLVERMLGGFLFGALGGGILAYFLDNEAENN